MRKTFLNISASNLRTDISTQSFHLFGEYTFKSITIFIILAMYSRELEVADFGLLSSWLAVLGIATQFIYFGTGTFLFTRVRRKAKITNGYFKISIFLRVMALLVLCSIFMTATFAGIHTKYASLILLICIAEVFSSLREIVIIEKKTKVIFRASAISFFLSCLLISLQYLFNYHSLWLAAATISASRIISIILYITGAKVPMISYHQMVSLAGQSRRILIVAYNSVFIMISTIIATINLSLPIFILNYLDEGFLSGTYGAALRLIMVILIIPSILINMLFNNLSKTIFIKYSFTTYLMVIYALITALFALPIIFIISDNIVYIVYGEKFLYAGEILKFLALVILPQGLRMIYSKALLLSSQSHILLLQSILIGGLNIILSWIFYLNNSLEWLYTSILFSECVGLIFILIHPKCRRSILTH